MNDLSLILRTLALSVVIISRAQGEISQHSARLATDVNKPVQRLYPVYKAGKWGFMDSAGKILVPLKFEWTDDPCNSTYWKPYEKLAPVKIGKGLDARWGYIDATGTTAIPPRFTFVGPFVNGLARAFIASNDPFKRVDGYIDESGEFVIRLKDVRSAGDFNKNGFAPVTLSDGTSGQIDKSGHILTEVEKAANIRPLNSRTKQNSSDHLVVFHENNKYGFKDAQDKVVIAPKWDRVTEFDEDGVAGVQIGHTPHINGWINTKGEYLGNPRNED